MSSRQTITSTFAVEASALDAGDTVANAVIEWPVSGFGIGRVMGFILIDPDAQSAANNAGNLWLFSSTVTPAAADAAHSISDADAAKCIGVVPIAAGDCATSALNTVATVRLNPPLQFDLGAGTSIFGILTCTATPTHAGASMTIKLLVA